MTREMPAANRAADRSRPRAGTLTVALVLLGGVAVSIHAFHGTRRWQLAQATAAVVDDEAGPGWLAWGVLAAGLTGTALLTVSIATSLSRARALRAVVDRTGELESSNRALQQEAGERRRAEEESRQSATLLALLTDTLPVYISYVGADQRYRWVNRRYEEWFHRPRDQIIGRHVREVQRPESYEAMRPYLERALRGERVQYENPLTGADGAAAVFDTTYLPHRAEDGAVLGFSVLVSDITQRVRAEEALRRSEATTRALLDAVPDLMFRMDRRGRYLAYHAQDLGELAAPPEQFLGRTAREVLAPERAEQCMRSLERAFRTGASQTYEYETVRPGRPARQWEVRVVPCGSEEVLLLVRDVSQRKRDEARLHESEQRLSMFIRQSPLGVIVWNADFAVAEWNPAAERVFGYPASEAVGRHASFIIADRSRAQVDEVFRALLERRGGERSTNENTTRDGRTILCEWYNTPLVDADGKVVAVASIVQDVTERKQAERRQTMMMAELDHRVKNNLAAVHSLAQQSIRSATSVEEFRETFMGRLRALERMHNALARSHWEGIGLLQLVQQTLEAYRYDQGAQVSIEGEDVTIPARAASPLVMALQELAINAAKYGAFSTQSGRVAVRWTTDNADGGARVLCLVWTESGGPPVSAPTRRGFGSELIEGGIAFELKGTVRLEFPSEGVRCQMIIPLDLQAEAAGA